MRVFEYVMTFLNSKLIPAYLIML